MRKASTTDPIASYGQPMPACRAMRNENGDVLSRSKRLYFRVQKVLLRCAAAYSIRDANGVASAVHSQHRAFA